MLQHNEPDDFVIASGISHSLEELATVAFHEVGLDWRDHVEHDPALLRPSDILCSRGDPSKAAKVLGWRSRVDFHEIVKRMVWAERDRALIASTAW
jgi:GDPmannose 4,6-dehydratase